LRLEVHVRAGAARTEVGGSHDGALVVRVAEPPDRGRATNAALGAVADALGVPHRAVTLVRGATSRRKLVDVAAGDSERAVQERIRQLLGAAE
jgi:uncharacterized protein YggU (UPF0235/DUF167 family)